MKGVSDAVDQNFAALKSRYAGIIPDIEMLKQTLHQPLPQCFWFNPLKITRPQFLSQMSRDDIGVQPLGWCDDGFVTDRSSQLGLTWQYLVGLLQIQEEVSMLPVKVLNPSADDCVLDMCAAPGNKTAQIAIAMQNQGTLVANDVNYQRLKALGQISKRLGIMNINLCVSDAGELDCGEKGFSKILLDAPCSCEGTLRKKGKRVVVPRQSNSERMANIQIALLKRAIKLAEPGAQIVYSTCTFAPEENEGVIDTVLKQSKGTVKVLPINLPCFNYELGLTQWNGRQFSNELEKTWRIWPHLNNTGGFYVASLQKQGELKRSVAVPIKLETSEEIRDFTGHLQSRFDFKDAILDQYHYFSPSRRGVYATHLSNRGLLPAEWGTIKFDSVGLFFMKTKIKFPKLTSSAVMVLGRYARKHVVVLNRGQLDRYLMRQDVLLQPEQKINCAKSGYVVVIYDDICVGLGMMYVAEGQQQQSMKSLFPGCL